MSENGTYSKTKTPIKIVHRNLDQEVIHVTEDKLRLVLIQYLSSLEKKNSWVAPFSVFITIITVFATTTFKDFFLSSSTWEAIFLIIGVLSFIWTLVSSYKAIKTKSVEDVICRIKNTSSE